MPSWLPSWLLSWMSSCLSGRLGYHLSPAACRRRMPSPHPPYHISSLLLPYEEFCFALISSFISPLSSVKNVSLVFPDTESPLFLTIRAMWAEIMHPLELSTSRALAQRGDILQRLAGHLAVALLHVRCLLLGHSLEDALPDVLQQFLDRSWQADLPAGDRDGRQGEGQGELPHVELHPGRPEHSRGQQAGKQRARAGDAERNGGHCNYLGGMLGGLKKRVGQIWLGGSCDVRLGPSRQLIVARGPAQRTGCGMPCWRVSTGVRAAAQIERLLSPKKCRRIASQISTAHRGVSAAMHGPHRAFSCQERSLRAAGRASPNRDAYLGQLGKRTHHRGQANYEWPTGEGQGRGHHW